MNSVDVYRSVLQTDYCEYCQYVNDGWIPSRFHRFLCDKLQSFVERDASDKAFEVLILSTPPQHGKSLTVTETFPSWYLGKWQKNKVIEISYSDDFAERFGRRNRQKVKDYGGKIFGIALADSPNTAKDFELDNHLGGMKSVGALAGVTGNKCNLMIIDDPIKTQVEASSETTRNKLWEEWMSSWTSRMSPGGKIIIIMTRWHEDDLAGRVMENVPNVEVINLPLEAEKDDPLGREVGEPLCPEIGKGKSWLADFKQNIVGQSGSRVWNSLYQGHPVAMEGNLIKRSWWQYYETLPDVQEWLMSVDATFKDGENNDFVAIQVWAKLRADMYLVDSINKHLDFPSTMREIVRLRGMYRDCKITLIEDKANGPAIIQMLRTEIGGVIPVNPEGGKVARVNAIAGAIESGNVYLPANKPFTAAFVDQFSAFPKGKHDDMVDACFVAGTKIATPFGDRNIENISVGDMVLTPFGARRVIRAGCTGERDVITRFGITGTPDHPFYADGKFVRMDTLTQRLNYSILSFKEVLLWNIQRQLHSTVSNTDLWAEDVITCLNQHQMKVGDMRKAFMLLFGNTSMVEKCRRVIRFTTKMVIALITILITLSAYHSANTMRCIIQEASALMNKNNILRKSDRLQQNGTAPRKEKSGTVNIGKKALVRSSLKSMFANIAERLFLPRIPAFGFALTTAMSSGDIIMKSTQKRENVLFAERNLKQKSHQDDQGAKHAVNHAKANCSGEIKKQRVYNLEVEKDHLYYAGGFLVHNCSQVLNRFIYYSAEKKIILPEDPIYKAFPQYKKTRTVSATGKGAQIHVI